MDARYLLLASLVLSCMAITCSGNVSFSSLQKTLVVKGSPKEGQVLKAGDDHIDITWSLNQSFPGGTDSAYKTIKMKLCYAPISQVDRGWRKTNDDLSKDKTCQHDIVSRPYTASKNNTYIWTIERDVPSATYFIRAYVLNSAGSVVAFGQTTDSQRKTNVFQIQAISGRHVSLDVCSICFSAFSVVSLFVFFFIDKKKNKSSQQK